MLLEAPTHVPPQLVTAYMMAQGCGHADLAGDRDGPHQPADEPGGGGKHDRDRTEARGRTVHAVAGEGVEQGPQLQDQRHKRCRARRARRDRRGHPLGCGRRCRYTTPRTRVRGLPMGPCQGRRRVGMMMLTAYVWVCLCVCVCVCACVSVWA
jgi:hypothetical protein